MCEHAKVAQDQLGEEVAESLFARMADIAAASSVNELLFGQEEKTARGSAPAFCVPLEPAGKVQFVSNHSAHNSDTCIDVDWSQVTRIRIVKVTADAES